MMVLIGYTSQLCLVDTTKFICDKRKIDKTIVLY